MSEENIDHSDSEHAEPQPEPATPRKRHKSDQGGRATKKAKTPKTPKPAVTNGDKVVPPADDDNVIPSPPVTTTTVTFPWNPAWKGRDFQISVDGGVATGGLYDDRGNTYLAGANVEDCDAYVQTLYVRLNGSAKGQFTKKMGILRELQRDEAAVACGWCGEKSWYNLEYG